MTPERKETLAYVPACAAVTSAAFIIWFFLWDGPQTLLKANRPCDNAKYLEADNRIRSSVLTAVGGLVAVCGLILNWRQLQANQFVALSNKELALSNNASALRTQILTEQGQITTRFKDAASLLGNENFAVRIGAIASLGRILHDSQQATNLIDTPSVDYWPILDVLVAYIQTNATAGAVTADFSVFEKAERLRPDLQAALNVIGRRQYLFPRTNDSPVDLAGVVLRYAYVVQGEFNSSYLDGTDLSSAWMMDAHFDKVQFGTAKLTDCRMTGCSIKGSDLTKVDGLTQVQVDDCIGDDTTTLPNSIVRPASWGTPKDNA